MGGAASTLDFRELARRRLPHFLFEYIDGGSYGEITLKRNVDDLAAIALRQRVLTDVSNLDLSATLFGEPCAMPVALGPIGLAGMNARRGEVQAARAAEKAGIRCNSVLPGTILTDINKDDLADPDKRARMAARIPLGRLGAPEDLAGPIVFLASDMARYVTGAALLVDGGAFVNLQ